MLMQILLKSLVFMMTEKANAPCVKTKAAAHFTVLRRGSRAGRFGFTQHLVALLQPCRLGFHHFVGNLQNPAALLSSATSSCNVLFSFPPFLPGAAFGLHVLYSQLPARSCSPAHLLAPPHKDRGRSAVKPCATCKVQI